MKQYDICILIKNYNAYLTGTYVIVLEMIENKNYLLVELWDFERFDGAEIDIVETSNLRLATDEEIEIYQARFKMYCDKNGV